MESVSVRDLKNQLSAYLRRVKSGTRLVVTDRGRPIAELGPVSNEKLSSEEHLRKMAEAGEIIPPHGKGFSDFKPIAIKGAPLSQTILEERRERF